MGVCEAEEEEEGTAILLEGVLLPLSDPMSLRGVRFCPVGTTLLAGEAGERVVLAELLGSSLGDAAAAAATSPAFYTSVGRLCQLATLRHRTETRLVAHIVNLAFEGLSCIIGAAALQAAEDALIGCCIAQAGGLLVTHVRGGRTTVALPE